MGEPVCDDCSRAWIPVATYLIFNVFYNSFTLLIVKHGGAALSFVIATLRLPLTTICFYSTAIVGVDATNPTVFDFFGLLVLVIGLAIYRWGSAIRLEESDLPKIMGEGLQESADYPLATGESTVLEVGLLDDRSLLPIKEGEEEDLVSESDEVPLAALVVEPGPCILRIHHHRTRPLYLRPVRATSDDAVFNGYHPPCFSNQVEQSPAPPASPEVRLPRRRTLHDFREAQIQKIHQRRLLFGAPSLLSERLKDDMPFPTGSDFRSSCEDQCEEGSDGHLSDGSVNSLTGASRPHPLELPVRLNET